MVKENWHGLTHFARRKCGWLDSPAKYGLPDAEKLWTLRPLADVIVASANTPEREFLEAKP
jgi:hypothetical protein